MRLRRWPSHLTWHYLWPSLVLLLSLVLTWQLWHFETSRASEEWRDEFAFFTQETVGTIVNRMHGYEQVLRGAKGLFLSGGVIRREQFHAYISALNLADYPGIESIGYSPLLSAGALPPFLAETRRSGLANYTIQPAGERSFYAPLLYTEPLTIHNRGGLGFDIYSDPILREALLRACDRNEAAITAATHLGQRDKHPTHEFLMYLPIYHHQAATTTAQQRRAAISGWVSMPFHFSALMQGVLGAHHGVGIQIFDGVKGGAPLFFGSAPGYRTEGAIFTTEQQIMVAGRPWRVVLHASPEFVDHLDTTTPKLVVIAGGVVSLLLALLVGLLVSGRARAVRLLHLKHRALIESESQMRTLFETAGEGIWMVDMARRTTRTNRVMRQMLGVTTEEMEQRSIYDFVDAPGARTIKAMTTPLQSEGRGQRYEMTFYHTDGHQIACLFSIAPIYNGQGEQIGSFALVTDISELKQAEAQLRILSVAVEQAPLSVVITDFDANIQYVNPRFTEVTGYDREEVIGMNPRIMQSGLTPRPTYDHLWETVLAGKVWHGEMANQRKNGDVYWEEVFISPVSDQTGTITHYVGVKMEITTRKAAEMQLRKLSQAVEQVSESVVMTDRQGIIEYVNPTFTAMTGYSRIEAIGQKTSLLKSGVQNDQFYADLWAALLAGKSWRGHIVDRCKDGRHLPVSLSVSPIFDEGGEITHFVGIFQDVTEQEQREEQFRQTQKLEALGTLVAGIAHDFNNILSVIIGNAILARLDLANPEKLDQELATIERLGQKAAVMIRHLLVYARKDHIRTSQLSLARLLVDALNKARQIIPEPVVVHLAEVDRHLTISGDENQLQQVVLNLIDNAALALAGRARPLIEISAERQPLPPHLLAKHPKLKAGEFARIVVRDNGCGIGHADLKRIFDPFFTTREVGQGPGLGLAMVHGAIERHHGQIEVTSKPGIGTTFTIWLPLASEHE